LLTPGRGVKVLQRRLVRRSAPEVFSQTIFNVDRHIAISRPRKRAIPCLDFAWF
jgi:hypothetical protein